MVKNWPARLVRDLLELPFFHIAFSGGLDSRFICYAAKLLGCKFIAWHVKGPHIPAHESEQAMEWARKNNISAEYIDFDPLQNSRIAANDRKRCYYCKRDLFARICAAGRIVVDGTNADDLTTFRPGLLALRELGIISPLANAGLTKKEIHILAARIGLDDPWQKARPCLLTRFAYGQIPDYYRLQKIEKVEAEIAKIAGSLDFRLRLLPNPLLQIEEGDSFDMEKAYAILHEHGFENVAILPVKSVSGFFDKPCTKNQNGFE